MWSRLEKHIGLLPPHVPGLLVAVLGGLLGASIEGLSGATLGATAGYVAGFLYRKRQAPEVILESRNIPLKKGGPEPAPSQLLRPESQVVPFQPRPEMDDLISWCGDGTGIAVRLYTGRGGMGKTRLFIKARATRRTENRLAWMARAFRRGIPNPPAGNFRLASLARLARRGKAEPRQAIDRLARRLRPQRRRSGIAGALGERRRPAVRGHRLRRNPAGGIGATVL